VENTTTRTALLFTSSSKSTTLAGAPKLTSLNCSLERNSPRSFSNAYFALGRVRHRVANTREGSKISRWMTSTSSPVTLASTPPLQATT